VLTTMNRLASESHRDCWQQRAVLQQLLKKWQPYLQLQYRFGASRLGEQLKLHGPQSCVATHDDSALQTQTIRTKCTKCSLVSY
jgi:hypothetical protein